MTELYSLQSINVIYDNNIVLDIPNLSISSGKCIALLGENGAGKSSLLKLLAGNATPTQGELSLCAQEMKYPLSSTQRRTIGFVDQHPYLLPGTVKDNLKLALSLQSIPPGQHALLISNALTVTNTSHLEDNAANILSGGELKRVAIARALVYQPDILLLDEPFSHLDEHQIHVIEELIRNLSQQKDKTVIFSSHNRLQSHALADETLNLVAGRLTTSPLINLFHGELNGQVFITPNIQIHVNNTHKKAQHLAIDPHEIILSLKPLESSMRNHFQGRIILIAEEDFSIRLLIDCGEQFHVIISPESLNKLNLSLGDFIFINFKSTAITLF